MAFLRNFSFACTLLVMCLSVSFAYEPDPYDLCVDVRYRNIGCFNDFHMRKRPLPNRLTLPEGESAGLKRKDFTVILNNATLKAWNDDLYQFVCTCAKAAKNEGYEYFGVLNFGECWGAKTFLVNVNGLSNQCLTYDRKPCVFNSKQCVGKEESIYAYNVVTGRMIRKRKNK